MQRVKCSECEKIKSRSEFHERGNGRPQSMCKECRKKYHREHYLKNRDAYRKKANDLRDSVKRSVSEKKALTPCADCGLFFHPIVMDFDHRGAQKKENNVSALVHSTCTKKVAEEIDKCDVVCANCHRVRTYNRRHKTNFSGQGSKAPLAEWCKE